jgi:GrpB-like predicted nucleotidyltransferase (UPF0157 family)
MSRPVIVRDSDPAWPMAFAATAAELRALLGGSLLRIEHVGSTAVPGLAAKPTIDLLVETADVEACAEALIEAGWESARNRLDHEHRLVMRRQGEHRTHHLHCFRQGSEHIRRLLAFRDYLLAHPAVAGEYGGLKRALALEHPRDIEAYMREKDAFVKRHEALALRWAGG